MKTQFFTLSALLALNLFSTHWAFSADAVETALDTLREDLKQNLPGTIHLNIRTRYEWFDAPGVERKGFSQRLRYGYTTPSYEGFSAMVEGETLYALNGSHRIHPLDQAGQGTELNQLWGRYEYSDVGSIKVGRQVYTLGNQRFIGHVGWRQNMQTFDAATAEWKASESVTLRPFYLDRVRRVTGTGEGLDGYGIDMTYAVSPLLQVNAFAMRLDFDRQAAWSNNTWGVRLHGQRPMEDVRVDYAVSYAYQTENSGSGGRDFSLSYLAGDVSATVAGISVGGGFELLEGDGTNGFRTPLATVHAFNGFADKFLPLAGFPLGLDDRYVYLGYRIPVGNGIPIRVTHHWFRPETGSGRYGNEIDLIASYQINRYFSLVAKYGRYRASSRAVGAGIGDKDMFTFEVNFNF